MRRAVAAWVASLPPGSAAVAIALSGGRDSVTLLDALAEALAAAGRRAIGLHVHHGLQPGADAWAEASERACADRGVAFAMRRVSVSRAPRRSLEADARDARYGALASMAREHGAGAVALAHHQDDQAETLLLQLHRGAGPAGLAAMPAASRDADGLLWSRPLLAVTRAAIDAYAAARRLDWVDDPSNADERYRRNAVRARIAPALAATFPGYPATLARAAAHQADAVALMDALAEIDARDAAFDAASRTIGAAALAALPPPRARNLLRWYLRACGLPSPSSARLEAMLRQLAHARDDASIGLAHAGARIGRHRGRVAVHAAPPGDYEAAWHGEAAVALPHGLLAFERAVGDGIDLRHAGCGLLVRPRRGGERMRLGQGVARRMVKSLLREAGVPAWERDALPLIVAGDRIVAVPGLGVDVGWRAAPGLAGLVPCWHEGNGRAVVGKPAGPGDPGERSAGHR